MTPDARGALCLTCRTALAPGETCDAGAKHRVVSLADPGDRRVAVDAVWGPPHLRARSVATASGTGGGIGAVFEGCGACEGASFSGEVGAIIFGILLFAIVAIALWWIVTRIVHAIRARRSRVRPQGAVRRAALPSGVTGVVTRGQAWGIELRHGDGVGTEVMLRDGGTDGLAITLEDGRVVEIPAGRLRLEGDGRAVDATPYAARVDPAYRKDDDHPVIPCDDAREVQVGTGDRVALISAVETRPDPRAAATGYRDAAASILVPAQIPWLRRLA